MRRLIRPAGEAARHLISLCVVLLPPLLLAPLLVRALVHRADSALEEARPIAESVASGWLGRPVRVGRLSPDLTVGQLWRMFQQPETFGAVPVAAEGLRIGLRPDERALAGQDALGEARRVTAYLSVAGLLGGHPAQEGLVRVVVEGLDFVLMRDRDGVFQVERLLPPPREKPDPTRPPFRTWIEVRESRLRFRDAFAFAQADGRTRLADNSLDRVEGYADLTGYETFRYRLSARARPGTPTAARLGGALVLSGSNARGLPGDRPDGPAPGSPRYFLRVEAADAAAAYWFPYWVSLEDIRLARGRADVRFFAAGIRPERRGAPNPPSLLRADVRFWDGALTATAFPRLPLEGLRGTLAFDDSLVTIEASGKAPGGEIQARGSLWNLRRSRPSDPLPAVFARLQAPRLAVEPLRRALEVELPAGWTLGAEAGLTDLTVRGPLTHPVVLAQVRLPRLEYAGLPAGIDAQGMVSYADGRVTIERAAARIDGGGRLEGEGAWRFAQRGADGALHKLSAPKQSLSASGQVTGLDIARVDALRLTDDPRGKLSGRLKARFTARRADGKLTVDASVQGDRLAVGTLAVPVAQARLRSDGLRVDVRGGRLLSRAGQVRVEGRAGEKGMDLRLTAAGLDLGEVGAALQIPSMEGLVSATATVTGTPKAPRIEVQDVVGFDLAWREEDRRYRVDTGRCDRLTLTRSPRKAAKGKTPPWDLTLQEPLRLRRFPALAAITGGIRGLGGDTPPVLGLTARVTNLDIAEAVRQASPEGSAFAPAFLRETPEFGLEMRRLGWSESPARGVSAVVTEASLQMTGPLPKVRVEGVAQLGRMLLGPYPVDEGVFGFRYAGGNLTIRDLRLSASIGEVTGALRLAADGALSGHLEAPSLRLESLSFLTDEVAALDGTLVASAELSGTRDAPALTVRIDESSTIEVAGTRLARVSAPAIRARADLSVPASPRFTVEAPELSFRQAGARVGLRDLQYALETGRFSTRLEVSEGDLETLVSTLRRSRLDETLAGERLMHVLDEMPSPLAARFTLAASFSGIVSEEGIAERQATARLSARDVRIGAADAQTVTASARLEGDVVTVEKLQAERPGALIQLSRGGRIDLPAREGAPLRFDLTLDSVGASLDLVQAFLPSFPLRGAVDVTIELRGTSDAPRVMASVDGVNLRLALRERMEFPLASVRCGIEWIQEASGGRVEVRDGRIVHENGAGQPEDVVAFDLSVPFERTRRSGLRVAPAGNLRVQARVDHLALDTLSTLVSARGWRAAGAISGQVEVTGDLTHPKLAGGLDVRADSIRAPRLPSDRRDPLNPVTNLRLAVGFEGDTIRIREGNLALGPLGNEKKTYGQARVDGTIRLTNLSDLARSFEERAPDAPPLSIEGTVDLTARLEGFTPDTENLTALFLADAPGGLGEAARARIDGEVKIEGALMSPRVATAPGRPLRLTDALLILPRRPGPGPQVKPAPSFNPEFDIEVEIPRGARVANAGSVFPFGFETNGAMRITGTGSDPLVRADLTTVRGFFQYATAAFFVRKGGEVTLSYGGRTTGIRVSDLIAEASILWNGDLAYQGRASQSGSLIGLKPTTFETGQRLRVIAELNGPLDILGDSSGRGGAEKLVRLSSDPPLTEEQILRVIGNDVQLRQLASGDAEGALKSGFAQVYNNYLIPRLLDPVTRGLASAFGLDDIRLDYNPDGTAVVQIVTALPDPLNRFSVSLVRAFQTRSTLSRLPPLQYSLTYDLFQFRPSSRFQPRLQVGALSDEQRRLYYFLRGTVTY